MRINRTLALTLVGAIAAGSSVGCTIIQKSDDATGGSDTGKAKGGSSAKGGASSRTTGGAAGEAAQGGAAGEAAQGGAAGEAAQGGSSNTSSTAACLKGAGAVVDCTTVRPGPSCDPFPFPEEACVAGQGNLKPAVAANFAHCVTGLNESEVCDATNTYNCLYDALRAACPAPETTAACETIRTVCNDVTQEECERFANGTNAAGLSSYQDCMTESSYCMPQSCAEGLTW